MYEVIDDYVYYIFESQDEKKIFYKDITNELLSTANGKISEVKCAKYVTKNGKRYYVNKTNKIIHKNREVENAKWYVNIMGGKLVYLLTISEDGGVACADYKYYPMNSNKWYYLEEKEIIGRSKNVFYHALESKHNQAEIFLIDCNNSNLTDKEIMERINMVFISSKNDYIKALIIKNNNKLSGVFKKRE